MADPEVKLKFVGSDADAIRAIANLEKKLESLEQGSRQMSRKLKEAGKDGTQAFNDMAAGGLKLGQSLVGIYSPIDLALKAMQLLKGEFDDMVKRREKALETHKGMAGPVTDLLTNVEGGREQINARLEKLTRVGIPLEAAIPAMNEAQSAKGRLSDERVDETLLAASHLKHSRAAFESTVGAAMEIQKQLDVTPQQAIGFGMSIQQASRVKDNSEVNRNVIPAILDSAKLGVPINQSAALNTAITQGAADVTGRSSRTAQTALTVQLQKNFPEFKNPTDAIEAMRNDPDLKKAFLYGGKTKSGRKMEGQGFSALGPDGEEGIELNPGHATFEKKMLGTIDRLLTKGTPEHQEYQRALTGIVDPKKAEGVYQSKRQDFANDPVLQVADISMRSETQAQGARLRDVKGASIVASQKGLDEMLKAAGEGLTSRSEMSWSAFWRRQAGDSPVKASRVSVEQKIEALDRQQFTTVAGKSGFTTQRREETGEERERRIKLEKIRDELRTQESGAVQPAAAAGVAGKKNEVNEEDRKLARDNTAALQGVTRELSTIAEAVRAQGRAGTSIDRHAHEER